MPALPRAPRRPQAARPRRRPRAAAASCVGATSAPNGFAGGGTPSHSATEYPCQLGARIGRRRAIEVEHAHLTAQVGFDSKRVLVGPGDLETRRQPHDAAGSERAARFAGRGVGRRVPAVGDLPPERVQRHRRVVAFRRRDHPPAPVLGDLRDPVAGDVDLRCVARRARGRRPRGLRRGR